MTLARGLRRQLDRAKQKHAEAHERWSKAPRRSGRPVDVRVTENARALLERAELNVIALKERLIDVLGRGE